MDRTNPILVRIRTRISLTRVSSVNGANGNTEKQYSKVARQRTSVHFKLAVRSDTGVAEVAW